MVLFASGGSVRAIQDRRLPVQISIEAAKTGAAEVFSTFLRAQIEEFLSPPLKYTGEPCDNKIRTTAKIQHARISASDPVPRKIPRHDRISQNHILEVATLVISQSLASDISAIAVTEEVELCIPVIYSAVQILIHETVYARDAGSPPEELKHRETSKAASVNFYVLRIQRLNLSFEISYPGAAFVSDAMAQEYDVIEAGGGGFPGCRRIWLNRIPTGSDCLPQNSGPAAVLIGDQLTRWRKPAE